MNNLYYYGNDNEWYLPMFKLYHAIMTAFREEDDDEREQRFHNGTFEFTFTDGNGNRTTYKDCVCPYTFEAMTDALEAIAERKADEENISEWLVKLFEDVKAGNETFICK